MLQRVQLILDTETKKDLRRVANLKKRSMSEVARQILKKNLKKQVAKTDFSAGSFLVNLGKTAVAGPGNSDYDKYAYE